VGFTAVRWRRNAVCTAFSARAAGRRVVRAGEIREVVHTREIAIGNDEVSDPRDCLVEQACQHQPSLSSAAPKALVAMIALPGCIKS